MQQLMMSFFRSLAIVELKHSKTRELSIIESEGRTQKLPMDVANPQGGSQTEKSENEILKKHHPPQRSQVNRLNILLFLKRLSPPASPSRFLASITNAAI